MLWYLVIIHLKSLNRHCVNKFVIVIHLLTNTARQIPGNIHLVFNRLINLTSIKTGQVRHGPGGCPDNFQRVVGVGGSWPQGLTREELRKRVRERLVREEDGRERGRDSLGRRAGGSEGEAATLDRGKREGYLVQVQVARTVQGRSVTLTLARPCEASSALPCCC